MDLSNDREDFELLTRRLSASNSSAASSLVQQSGINHPTNDEIYPLHLTTNFIEHYVIGDIIGSGSYAEVRECINTQTLERCALKIINQDYLKRQAPGALWNQMQEIRLLKRLRHVNIIGLREVMLKGSRIYIALEYCSFVLSDLLGDLPDNRLSVPIARDFFHQICNGLNYLHSIGIVHRDIKPQNLLITNSGVLKIIDFGVSQMLSMWIRKDECSNYEGSPLFQAPEVVCGETKYAGFKVDVWSAGVTLYLMLYGKYPFFDEALLGLYDKILSEDFQIPSGAPSQLALTDLLGIMLEKVSEKRASIGELLDHPWLKLDTNHHYDHDDEHLEFVDLVLAKQSPVSSGSGLDQNRQLMSNSPTEGQPDELKTDIYRSISVLPYLYRYHFPNLLVTKARRGSRTERRASSASSSSPSPSPSPSPSSERHPSSPSSTSSSSSTVPSSGPEDASPDTGAPNEATNPNRILDPPDGALEWGTRAQYQLMKVPPVRANRMNDSDRRRQLRRRNRRQKRNRQDRGHQRTSSASKPKGEGQPD